jgi:hypothetical protein
MAIERSFEGALSALKKLRAEKLRRRGSTGMVMTIQVSEADLKNGRAKKLLRQALLKKIK